LRGAAGFRTSDVGRNPPSAVAQGQERGSTGPVLFFFSNRLGCMGSVMVSLIGTLLLLLVLGVVRLG
jgi:hypothetical protein